MKRTSFNGHAYVPMQMAGLEQDLLRMAIEKQADMTPEDCYLAAFHTGEGWALTVNDTNGEVIAYLAWPASFGEEQTEAQLIEKGFTIE